MHLIISNHAKTSTKNFLMIPLLLSLMLVGMPQARAGSDDYPSVWKDAAQDSLLDTWRLYNRECTSFCAWRLHSRNGFEITPAYGDAKAWGTHAKNQGYTVNMIPNIGAIAWWDSDIDHVAWVESINGANVTVEEYNQVHGQYSERVVNSNSVSGYIHFQDIQTTSDTDIWVDGSHASGGDGSQGNPYNTVNAAITKAVTDGASKSHPITIHITPGYYNEKINTNAYIHFVTNGSGTVRIGG